MFSKYIYTWILLLSVLLLAGCNTGIEGTKTIKMSRAEQKRQQPSPEQLLSDSIVAPPLGEWRIGKPFYVADERASLILRPEIPQNNSDLTGKILKFLSIEETRDAGGGLSAAVVFADSVGSRYRYPTGKGRDAAMGSLTGLDIPILIDLDLVDSVDKRLRGRKVWTRTSLWTDDHGQRLNGLKFVPVVIESVTAGDAVFPFRVSFRDAGGTPASMMMNVRTHTGIGAETRTFPDLFSLSDPRNNYSSIADDVWELICAGKVKTGMTKGECKLALGNPAEVDTGHNWGNLIDIWQYKDGTVLYFEDGRLTKSR